MILLDTDHLSILKYENHPRSIRLQDRLNAESDENEIATTIVNVEEQMRGWLARIHSEREPHQQVEHYSQLAGLLDFFSNWDVVNFDSDAADEFVRLRRLRLRLGTSDLKNASIAVANGALLLTANLRDFSRVPGLRAEDWLS